MNNLLVICGPTATGKTSLGIKLAKKLGGEIISADSRQVYQGMDIGTGKDLPKSSKLKAQSSKLQLKTKKYKVGHHKITGIPVWLYDIVKPNQVFSAAEYAKLAWLVIEDIWQRGKLPILVGGTGFYIKAVVEGIETINIPPDWKLRAKLRNYEITKLRKLLKELDPERLSSMNQSDRNNPRRLIRATEIAQQIRNPKSEIPNKSEILKSKFKTIFIGLTAPREVLYKRIDRRVEERIKQGIIKEIKRLLKEGYNWGNSTLGTTIGYKAWKPYFKNSQLREKIIQEWKYAEHTYARRQLTWFRQDSRIHWFDISKKGWKNKVDKLVEKFLI